ncbi:hypothetical protein [Gymnodinialimonas hymeniacidonis]|uniref:hypothetical protein n=1 Tax=Gymnodinialimonas hymeniacidonis TaxID=3126508 RepID=UPI0034C5EFBB
MSHKHLIICLASALTCLAAPVFGAQGQHDPVVSVQLEVPRGSVLEQAEALDGPAVEAIMDEAYAAIGCALPSDLVTVFEVYLVDQAMIALGEPVGADVAREGFFALRLRSTTIRHPEARAVLAVARALEGRVAADMRSGRLRMVQGLFEVEDCTPNGTLFALSPYAIQ